MQPQLRKPPADPYRKASFREEARDIVYKDRSLRKYGESVDTAGAIARALERAYKQGFVDAQTGGSAKESPEIPADGTMEWKLIPPRPRSAFWSCCLHMVGREGTKLQGYLARCITDRRTPGWRLIANGIVHGDWGDRTIQPLVRLSLLKPAESHPGCLLLSEQGFRTWREFNERGGMYPDDLTD